MSRDESPLLEIPVGALADIVVVMVATVTITTSVVTIVIVIIEVEGISLVFISVLWVLSLSIVLEEKKQVVHALRHLSRHRHLKRRHIIRRASVDCRSLFATFGRLVRLVLVGLGGEARSPGRLLRFAPILVAYTGEGCRGGSFALLGLFHLFQLPGTWPTLLGSLAQAQRIIVIGLSQFHGWFDLSERHTWEWAENKRIVKK